MADEDASTIASHALAVALRVATYAAALADSTIVFAGNSPYRSEDLEALLVRGTRTINQDDYKSEDVDIVVVGKDCDLEVITRAVDNSREPIFLPQEGFLDRVLFGFDWWQNDLAVLLDSYLDRYPGLRRAKELAGERHFKWPSTDAPESSGALEVDHAGFAAESPLLHECKYRITGTTKAARWHILTTCALPRFGLRGVAETIANHVRLRKARKGGRTKFAHAIAEWEWDLARLKREFYDGRGQRFRWPTVEP